ncbi:MAG TPA: hypothetical protein VGB30_13155 [bacterium]|jgi:hypothetical protein
MRAAFLVLLSMLFIGIACSGNTGPIAPEKSSDTLPSWTIDVDGESFVISLEALKSARTLADVDPGTDMTPAEIRQYFAVYLTTSMFPPAWWCPVYGITLTTLQAQPDSEVWSWVDKFESSGYDIPNGPPPDPPC